MASDSQRCGPRVKPVRESCVPVEDVDVIGETLLRARPVVLRGYASGWKARKWDLEQVAAGSPEAHVELQVSRVGQTQFHGFGGTLQREPLPRLPEAAAEAIQENRSLYLVQCPLWARSGECPARHLMNDVVLGPFEGGVLSRRLESVNLWMSLGETHSNLHYDSKHGLLVLLRGRKLVELFPPAAARTVGAYPVHDPLRSHHSRAPHCCLAARFEKSLCEVHADSTLRAARGFQADLQEGDALMIPEGWWHHVKTLGRANSEQASQTQPQLALAVNIWWRGYPREPKAARPYVLRRLLGEMLARRTASHFLRQKLRKPRKAPKVSKSGTSCLKSSRPQSTGNVSILEELSTAAQSEPPHREWLLALRTFGPVLPHCLAVAAASEDVQQQEAVHQLLDGLSPAQAAALLASLDAAALDMGEAAAALRLLWRHYPQRAIVAKWDEHLRSTLEDILSRVLSTT
ncbi:Hif1an [Symbiodinium microadriaticum]|nr:Hif1an [Symbiodinium microadriaticum]